MENWTSRKLKGFSALFTFCDVKHLHEFKTVRHPERSEGSRVDTLSLIRSGFFVLTLFGLRMTITIRSSFILTDSALIFS